MDIADLEWDPSRWIAPESQVSQRFNQNRVLLGPLWEGLFRLRTDRKKTP